MKNWAIWITGLPGSGKSTIAKELMKLLEMNKIEFEYLSMDKLRKIFTPNPKYTEEERDFAYNQLVEMANSVFNKGKNILIDATSHRKRWREQARNSMKNFIEVYVKCPLEICMSRESKRKNDLIIQNIYKKGLQRLKTREKIEGLGQIVGLDVPYEEPEDPEIIINSSELSPKQSAEKIFKYLTEN